MSKNAVIYARYSSTAQRDVSIDDQIQACKQFAVQQDYTVINTYADRAISGTTDQRPAFQQMISDSRRKLFKIVLVYKQDRFARNRYDAAIYKKRLQDNGAQVISAMEPVPEGSGGLILEAIYESMAQQYSENLSQNTLRGMNSNAQRCLANHQAPLGYLIDPATHKYIIDPKIGPLVTQAFAMVANGATTKNIRNHFLKYGVTRPISSYYHMLHNECYTGVYKWKNTRVPGGMPALVTPETWQAVQATRKTRKEKPAAAAHKYLLSGKVVCADCGTPMCGEYAQGRRGKVYFYYNCNNHKKARCQAKPIHTDDLEKTVLQAIVTRLHSDQLVNDIVDQAMAIQARETNAHSIALLQDKIKDATRRRDNLVQALEMGIMSVTTQSRLQALETEIEALTAQLQTEKIKAPAISAEALRNFLLSFRRGDISDPGYAAILVKTFCHQVAVAADKIYIGFAPLKQGFEFDTTWWPRRDSNPRPFGS